MTTAIQQATDLSAIETALVSGDLSKLTQTERISYYNSVCKSLGLNPLTRPFDYITLNNKLTLYARKDCTDQLRRINGVSIGKPDIQITDTHIIVTIEATDKNGRSDSDVGVVNKTDMRGDFGNALMKAVTKAKRRVTLSVCGLGMLDETEVETIPNASPVPEVVVSMPTDAKTALKDRIATLGKQAKDKLDAARDSDEAARLGAAISAARDVYAKNGSATLDELKDTVATLEAALA
jgi:hypothetical protein